MISALEFDVLGTTCVIVEGVDGYTIWGPNEINGRDMLYHSSDNSTWSVSEPRFGMFHDRCNPELEKIFNAARERLDRKNGEWETNFDDL